MKSMRRFKGRSRLSSVAGITLIEVLIAMIVLSLGILALAPMMVISITETHSSNQVTTLVTAAQEKIEDLIGSSGFSSLPYSETEYVDDSLYTVVTEVVDNTVDGSVPDRVYQITVAVHWQDDADVRRSLSFVTFANKR